jgi:hypothetical protein
LGGGFIFRSFILMDFTRTPGGSFMLNSVPDNRDPGGG